MCSLQIDSGGSLLCAHSEEETKRTFLEIWNNGFSHDTGNHRIMYAFLYCGTSKRRAHTSAVKSDAGWLALTGICTGYCLLLLCTHSSLAAPTQRTYTEQMELKLKTNNIGIGMYKNKLVFRVKISTIPMNANERTYERTNDYIILCLFYISSPCLNNVNS